MKNTNLSRPLQHVFIYIISPFAIQEQEGVRGYLSFKDEETTAENGKFSTLTYIYWTLAQSSYSMSSVPFCHSTWYPFMDPEKSYFLSALPHVHDIVEILLGFLILSKGMYSWKDKPKSRIYNKALMINIRFREKLGSWEKENWGK